MAFLLLFFFFLCIESFAAEDKITEQNELNESFLDAAFRADRGQMSVMLAQGASVNAIGKNIKKHWYQMTGLQVMLEYAGMYPAGYNTSHAEILDHAKFLIDSQADINYSPSQCSLSSLKRAISIGYPPLVKLLIDLEADVNDMRESTGGYNALWLAKGCERTRGDIDQNRKKRREIIEIIEDRGKNIAERRVAIHDLAGMIFNEKYLSLFMNGFDTGQRSLVSE